jgi:mRNA interferase MazF
MVLADGRVAEPGDVFWIEYGDPVGHEQAGRRPGVVLSPRSYNERSSLFLACPISRRQRGWPFEVFIPPVGRISGYLSVDQLRAVDPLARYCRYAGRIAPEALAAIRLQLVALFDFDAG